MMCVIAPLAFSTACTSFTSSTFHLSRCSHLSSKQQPNKRATHLRISISLTLPQTTKTSKTDENSNTSPTPSPSPSLAVSLAILNLTTVLWGTQHAVIKLALNDTNPSTLNFTRFALAAILSSPGLRNVNWRAPVIKLGMELSIYLFAGYALQSAALLTTTVSRSAFLLYLNVKFVPIFARLLYGRRITNSTWFSAALALLGTALLTYDGTPPVTGDIFSIAAAAASALFILRTENAAQSEHVTPASLNAVTLTSVTVLMGIWTVIASFLNHNLSLSSFFPSSIQPVGAIVYLAVVTTALCNYLQAIGQKHVPAERAAVVFAMDPVYAALFAWLLLRESLGLQGVLGAVLILGATVLSAVTPSKPPSHNNNNLVQSLNTNNFEEDNVVTDRFKNTEK